MTISYDSRITPDLVFSLAKVRMVSVAPKAEERCQMIIKIPYNIPSQNVTSRRHWTKDNAEKNRCASLISACMRNKFEHQGKVVVDIVSVRKKKISDKANLIGGAKYLIDGLVKARAIEDDSDAHVEIIYHQMVVKKGEQPHTVIELNEWIDPQIELDEVKKEFLRLKEIERLAVAFITTTRTRLDGQLFASDVTGLVLAIVENLKTKEIK